MKLLSKLSIVTIFVFACYSQNAFSDEISMGKPIAVLPDSLSGIPSLKQWSYGQCLEYALANNITLQKSILEEKTSELTLEEAKAQWQPSLDFATTQGFTTTPWSEGNKERYSSTYGLNAGWTVWNGGKRENTVKRSQLEIMIRRLNKEDILRSLQTQILSAYLNALYSLEAITIYKETLKVSEAQAERCRQLMQAGRVSKVDYSQLKAQAEQDRYNLVNSQGTYAKRLTELRNILQLGIASEIQPCQIATPEDIILAELPPIEESYELALASDAALKAIMKEQEQAALDEKIAKSSGLPSVSLSAGTGTSYYAPGGAFGTQLKQSYNAQLGLTLSVPILDNKRTKVAVAKAKIQELDAKLSEKQKRNDIARNLEEWYTDLYASQSRYRAALQQVKSSEVSSSLVDEQFALGLVNPVELLSAHQTLLEARHSLLQAKYMAMLGQKMIEWYRTSTITLPVAE